VASASHRERTPTPKRAAIQASVLEATEQLLAGGATYADLNIERIATRAGISRTAFYFYFRDKRELLMRLTEDVMHLLYGEADRWFSGDGDPAEEIRESLTNVARLYAEHAVLLRTIVEVSAYDVEIAGFWRGIVQRFVDASERRIAEAQAAGGGPAGSAGATAYSLCWMVERTLYQQLMREDPPPESEMVDALVGIWMRVVYGRVR
jgi:TetR/AcrR family transcriptional regulator, ethionamide resistance regulator